MKYMTSVKVSQLVLYVDKSKVLPTIDSIVAKPYSTLRERAVGLVRLLGMARARDFKAAGIPLVYLSRLTESGRPGECRRP